MILTRRYTLISTIYSWSFLYVYIFICMHMHVCVYACINIHTPICSCYDWGSAVACCSKPKSLTKNSIEVEKNMDEGMNLNS